MVSQIESQAAPAEVLGAGNSVSETASLSDWFTPWRFTVLLGLLLAVTFPGVLSGQQSFFFRDYGVLSYPTIFYARESFWRGEVPLWNPLSHCGVPFLAQWGAMVLYPFSIIYLLFPLPWSLGLFIVLHLLLGGCGMYSLAGQWTGNRFAGAVAGILFVFNGVVYSSLAWPNYSVALGWMPWVVLLTQTAYDKGGRRIVFAALAGAMQMLSGVPEIILLTWVFLGLLLVVDTVKARRPWLKSVVRFSAIVALVAGLCAAQLLPFFQLIAHSHRHAAYGTAAWSMPPSGWANLLLPLFRCVKSSQGIFFQPGHVFLITWYLGITTIVLSAMAVFTVRVPRVYLLIGCALFGLTISLGEAGYLYPWLKQTFPVLGFMRYPVKAIYLTLFALPLLAACAIERLSERHAQTTGQHPKTELLIFAGVATLGCAVLLWFAWHFSGKNQNWYATAVNAATRIALLGASIALLILVRNRTRLSPLLGCLLLGILWIDAQTHTPLPHPTIDANNFSPDLTPMKAPPQLGHGRALISDAAEDRLYRSGVADFREDFVGKRLALWCNLHLLEGIPKVEGASTLLVREQSDIQSLFYRNENTEHPDLADFLGATHISAPGQVTDWVVRSNALPLITAGQKPEFLDGTNLLRLLAGTNFNPRAIVYFPAGDRGRITATNGAIATITHAQFEAHRIAFETDAPQSSIVTIAQTFYPAWRAFIDGKETPILRANHAFQAIEVPAGTHRVTLAYIDSNWRLGCAISAGTLIICCAAGIKRRRSLGPSSLFSPATS